MLTDLNKKPSKTILVVLVLVGAILLLPLSAKHAEAREEYIGFSSLPKGPEDIYLILFENKPDDNLRDDDFITDAAEAVGYTPPFQWHVEIMYYNHDHNEWLVMGCRPPQCSMDYPVKELLQHYQQPTIRINRLKVPVEKQIGARKFFAKRFQGKPYALAGPNETNCSDVPKELSDELRIGKVKSFTKQELTKIPAIRTFLRRYRYKTINDLLKRDNITFPDAFENTGTRLGILRL